MRPTTTDTPVLRVSPKSKIALRAAAQELGQATGRPPQLGALLDELIARHLPGYVAARKQVLHDPQQAQEAGR